MNTDLGNGEHLFFTSDTHFGHKNIITICNRPFNSIEEMNETLIENWNKKVSPDDTIFHLGDFALGGSNVWIPILERLNGHKYLILGNHDYKNIREGFKKYFELVLPQMYVLIEGRTIYLNHFPFLCYGGSWKEDPTWQLFGHVHTGSIGKDTSRLKYLFPTQYDVGVDGNNFTPVSYAEVKAIITQQINESKNE